MGVIKREILEEYGLKKRLLNNLESANIVAELGVLYGCQNISFLIDGRVLSTCYLPYGIGDKIMIACLKEAVKRAILRVKLN